MQPDDLKTNVFRALKGRPIRKGVQPLKAEVKSEQK